MNCFLCFLTAVLVTGEAYHATVCVKLSSAGLNTSTPGCTKYRTLDMLQANDISSNTLILFEKGIHIMKELLNLSDMENIGLAGNTTAEIHCKHQGFKFANVVNLEIKHLIFSYCGICDQEEIPGLQFVNGSNNIKISHVNILKSGSVAILGYNVASTTITNLKMAYSCYCSKRSRIIFSYNNTSNDSLVIKNSLFVNNSWLDDFNDTFLKVIQPTVLVSINNSNATMLIENSAFFNNSGSNLAIYTSGTCKPNVTVRNSSFSNTMASRGAGLSLKITSYYHNCTTRAVDDDDVTIVQIESVLFQNNTAGVGVGIFLQQKNSPIACKSQVVAIMNSNFTNNVLYGNQRGGVALHSITYILKGPLVQVIPQFKPVLKGCCFSNNNITSRTTESAGNGVIFINKNEYFGITDVTVSDNNCSAILVVTSNLVFKGTTELTSNWGASGGGLLLCKNGILYFTPNTTLVIHNNTVDHTGGGICVESQCLQTKPRCFFQLYNVTEPSQIGTINVSVLNNHAKHAGHNLFGGLVDFCYLIDDKVYREGGNASLEIFERIFEINVEETSSVTSIPQHVRLCNESERVVVYPGKKFNVQVVVEGQLNGSVPGTVIGKFIDDGITLEKGQKIQLVNSNNCTDLSYTVLTDKTWSNSTLQLSVDHTGDISGFVKIPTYFSLNITVEVIPCPIGFYLSGKNQCDCSLPQETKSSCNLSSLHIMKPHSSWIGANNNNQLIFYKECPYDYCNNENSISIEVCEDNNNSQQNYCNSTEYILRQDNQCNYNRTGTLCGKCAQELSMVLGSSQCKRCSNKFLSLLLLFALAGLLLVFILIILNLTVAEGTLSGFVFYANIIWYNKDLFDPPNNYLVRPGISMFLNVFIAWVNLDLGIPTCFYNSMDAYQKAWLRFVFPAYIWVISITIIFLSQRSSFIAAIAGKNAVKVLATLILLSYAKFIQAAMRVFAYTNLQIVENGSLKKNETLLWLEDANLEYLREKHLVIFVFGVIFVAVCFPFTLTLLFIRQLQCVSHKRLFRWVQHLKPFLDAYTGPYTDYARFWPGLLLLVRALLSTAECCALVETRCSAGVLLVLLLLSVAKMVRQGLYEKGHLDKLETSFLLNLGALYTATIYINNNQLTKNKLLVWYEVSIGIAFLTFIGIVLYHVWVKVSHYGCTIKMIEYVCTKIPWYKRNTTTVNRLQNYPQFVRFDEDREPLLADHEE